MPQADLEHTAFFNDFLTRDGLHWGINLHAFDAAGRALGLSPATVRTYVERLFDKLGTRRRSALVRLAR